MRRDERERMEFALVMLTFAAMLAVFMWMGMSVR
jgi:hypothetical protein